MFYPKKTICFCLFCCLLFFVDSIWALSYEEKLAMLGYSEEEIAGIISGKTCFSELRMNYQMEMLGFEKSVPPPIKSVLTLYPDRQIPKRNRWDNPKTTSYFHIIEDAAKKNKLKKSLLMAVIKVESDFNANALSPKGAIGLMQIMPGTASDLGLEDPFDPTQNIHGGARYLSDCINKFTDLRLGLAAYNAGPNLVARLKRIPSIEETENYVENVLKYIKIYDRLDLPD